MVPKRTEPNDFPKERFVQQYNRLVQHSIRASQVQPRVLRSRKHATAEISITRDQSFEGGSQGLVFIAKHYSDAEAMPMKKELAVLLHSNDKGVLVPRTLHVLDNFLILEKIEGFTLMDLINDVCVPRVQKHEAMNALGAWLSAFHSAFEQTGIARRRGDANLRNFIMTPAGSIVGVDFEEADDADPARDLHETMDSIVQSDPGIFSPGQPDIDWKYQLCERLLRGYATGARDGARKEAADIVHDPSRFVEAQLDVMQRLAAIRGTSARLAPLVPAVRKNMELMIERFLATDSGPVPRNTGDPCRSISRR